MNSLLLLATSAFAHMHMSSPEPRFNPAFEYDKNAPSMVCEVVEYNAGSGTEVVPAFNQGLLLSGFKNLREYVDACAAATSTSICGNTVSNASVPFPADGMVNINIGADHVGPSEIWVDDRLVMSNAGIDGVTVIKTPPSSAIDFATECPSGNCLVRFVMAALHNSPAEIYDNCVRVTGTPSIGISPRPAAPTKTTTYSLTKTSFPIAPPAVPTSTSSNPYSVDEWTCKGKDLVHNLHGKLYEFSCPDRTECRTEGLPYAMCVCAA
jgi:hypothetical protein